MTDWYDERNFETLLADERPRLVRLCAWFTGSPEAAEDLAQETLIAAWKNRAQLISPQKFKPWTSAIARNVCLNWRRQHARERGRLAVDDLEEGLDGALPGDDSPEQALDRQEQARMLGQAMALLPAETAGMLVAHYLHDTPHAEIAAKLGLKAGTVAVRLQRGKRTLREALNANHRSEALAFGLPEPGGPRWVETNIWCPLCGKSRLTGQYQRHAGSGHFALRCPTCNRDPQAYMVGFDLSIPPYARLLGGVKAFKPAYTRLKNYIAAFFRQALTSGDARCPVCGGAVLVRVEHSRASPNPPYSNSEVKIFCTRCDWVSNSNLTGLVMALPEVRQFWRENPRIRTLSIEEVETQGAPAFVTRLQSLNGAAGLAVVSRRDTLEVIGVHKNPRI